MKNSEYLTLFLIGSNFFRSNFNKLVIQREGVTESSEIEYLHRMRVASRKLLSGLSTFEDNIPRKKLKVWQKDIRNLTKALGKVRDLDVQTEFLKNYKLKLKDDKYKTGIDRLILRLEQSRDKKHPDVVKAVKKIEASKFSREVRKSFSTKSIQKKLTIEKLFNSLFLKKINSIINQRTSAMLVFEEYIHDPKNVEELHELRKANKQLRYTLETFEGYYGQRFQESVRVTKQIQDLLGDIHDCDVWLQFIPEFIEEERRRTIDYFGKIRYFTSIEYGLKRFMRDMNEKRMLKYEEFIKIWDDLAAKDYWTSLSTLLNL